MEGESRLMRSRSHLYRIKPHEQELIFAGVTADRRQVLMGLYCPNLVAIFFNRDGHLIDVQQRVLKFMQEDMERGVGTDIDDLRIEPELEAWQEELGYQPAPINVHNFFVLEGSRDKEDHGWQREGIGIVDYPAHFHAILSNPDSYSEEQRQHVNEELPRWEQQGQFVLWWGNDYWFDGSGECVAS